MKIHTHDLLAYDGLKILQSEDSFRFSLDSLLLGSFIDLNLRTKKILEFGCGVGAVMLYLSLKTKAKIYGIDIQEDSLDLARQSIVLNNLTEQIEVFNQDIKTVHNFFEPSSFDYVISNPPFFKVHDLMMVNEKMSLSLSRHEISVTLSELLDSAKRMLKTNGAFVFIHRANRIEEIFQELKAMRFVVKKMRFVYTKPNKEALMVLIESRYNGKTGNLKILEPLYVYDNHGNYTEEILEIFHLGDEKYVKKS